VPPPAHAARKRGAQTSAWRRQPPRTRHRQSTNLRLEEETRASARSRRSPLANAEHKPPLGGGERLTRGIAGAQTSAWRRKCVRPHDHAARRPPVHSAHVHRHRSSPPRRNLRTSAWRRQPSRTRRRQSANLRLKEETRASARPRRPPPTRPHGPTSTVTGAAAQGTDLRLEEANASDISVSGHKPPPGGGKRAPSGGQRSDKAKSSAWRRKTCVASSPPAGSGTNLRLEEANASDISVSGHKPPPGGGADSPSNA
jgi:hypothetical protein